MYVTNNIFIQLYRFIPNINVYSISIHRLLNLIIKSNTYHNTHLMTLSNVFNEHLNFKYHIITPNGNFISLTAYHVFRCIWSSKIWPTRFLREFNFDKWVKSGLKIKVVEMFNFCRVTSFIRWPYPAGIKCNKKKNEET